MLRATTLFVLGNLLAAARLLADPNPVYLVEDIEAATATPFSTSSIRGACGAVYFQGVTPETGSTLWRTDGTPAGTLPMAPTSDSGFFSAFPDIDGTAFLVRSDPQSGAELWKQTCTPEATVLVKDIVPGSVGSDPRALTLVGDTLFFVASDQFHMLGSEVHQENYALWKSDGTAAGTVLVKDVYPTFTNHDVVVENLTDVNGTLFFSGYTQDLGWLLWKSTGTTAGTKAVADINPASSTFNSKLREFVNVNGTVFFTANDGTHGDELWNSDGTTAGTVLVKDINPSGSSIPPNPSPPFPPFPAFVNVNGTLFFIADDGTHGLELWKSDGTEAGTMMLKDILAGGASNPRSLTVVGDTLFFVANDGVNDPALWKTDGTETGTVLVKDPNPSTGSSSAPSGLRNFNGTLFFTASDGVNGTRVWTSDGTEAGTVIFEALPVGASVVAKANGTLFLTAGGPANQQLWRSDGTPEGTLALTNITGNASSSPHDLADVAGTLYFAATESFSGIEPWKSDGSAAGTQLLRDIRVAPPQNSSLPFGFTDLNGAILFRAFTPDIGAELWRTDGTAAGTAALHDLWPVAASSNPTNFTRVGDTIFFTAINFSVARLWKTDGTLGGTAIVGVPLAATAGSLTNVGGTLFLAANDGAHGTEVWKSDGTDAGTVMVKDVSPDTAGSPRNLTEMNGSIYFFASDGSGSTLWKTDGTDAGTVAVTPPPSGTLSNLVNVNGTLFYTTSGTFGWGLWKSDGTAPGTVAVTAIFGAPPGASPTALTAAGGTLFFLADDGVQGTELWKSDGTQAGTVRVPGSYNQIGAPYAVGPVIVFAATDAAGRELWYSDGTTEGTRRLVDIAPLGGSSPQNFKRSGSVLYFTATTNALGTELYGVPVAALTDFDLDGLLDPDERALGTDEFTADSDGDGLNDGAEVHTHGTNPLLEDTDGDGYSDGVEVPAGSDPLNPESIPAAVPLTGAWGYAALAALLLAAAARMRLRAR